MGLLAQGELNRALTVRRWAVVSARLGFLLLLCTLAGGSLAVPKTALAGSVSGVVVAPSPAVPGEPATYTIGFVSTSGLPAGTGTITVDASSGAPGTQFPEALGDYQLSDTTTGGVVKLAAVGAAGQQVTITVGTAVAAGDSLSLVVSDVTNPAVVSTDETLQVSTSSDTAQAASRPYSDRGRKPRSRPQFGLCRGADNAHIHLHCCDGDRRDVRINRAERLRLHPRRQLGLVTRPPASDR